MAQEKTITIRLEKATKNTIKYQEVPQDGEAPIAGTVYLQKWFAGPSPAQEWEVTFRAKALSAAEGNGAAGK
jgi:hypothetical protein